MEFDYEMEKANLKKKLITFVAVSVVFTIILNIAMSDIGFFTSLMVGMLLGLMFYIPSRLKSILHLGMVGVIIISVLYVALFIFLGDKIGNIAYFICVLIPLADMGFSIYKVVSHKNDN